MARFLTQTMTLANQRYQIRWWSVWEMAPANKKRRLQILGVVEVVKWGKAEVMRRREEGAAPEPARLQQKHRLLATSPVPHPPRFMYVRRVKNKVAAFFAGL